MLGEVKPIQRNAIIALAHFNEETAIPELKEVALNDKTYDKRDGILGDWPNSR